MNAPEDPGSHSPADPEAATAHYRRRAEAGDIDAHATRQQAIDARCDDADYWRDRISPAPEEPPEAAPYSPDLLPEFNLRNMVRTGLEVLEHGLLPVPDALTYQMSIPVAYWKAEQCAVVLMCVELARISGGQGSGEQGADARSAGPGATRQGLARETLQRAIIGKTINLLLHSESASDLRFPS